MGMHIGKILSAHVATSLTIKQLNQLLNEQNQLICNRLIA